MKVMVSHVWAAREGTEEEKYIRQWNRILRQNVDLVKAEGTELVCKDPRGGLQGLDGSLHSCTYSTLNVFNDAEVLRGVMDADGEGYDAILEGCFFDPVLRATRQAADIPVIAPGEAAMHMAQMMGLKFGLISIGPDVQYILDESIARYGLKDRAVPTRPIPATYRQQWDAVHDSHKLIEAAIEAGRQLIADGAEVIIPACIIMCPCLRVAPGAEKDYPDGLNYVDGVPILDVVGVGIKMAEAMVALKKAGSPWISRKGYYRLLKGDEKAFREARDVLQYSGPGFWTD
jgi:Asp/Glu/hydantoin racemase